MTSHPKYPASTLKRATRHALLAALVLLAGGCAAEDMSIEGVNGARPNCVQDVECPDEQICRAGLCSVPTSAATMLNFRFIPPSDSDFLPDLVESVVLSPQDPVDFVLRPALTISSGPVDSPDALTRGIHYDGAMQNGPDGTLIFRPINARSSLFIRETQVEHGTFRTRLNPGDYSITFVPTDRELLPKKTWPEQTFTQDTILARALRPPDKYTEIRGLISRYNSLLETNDAAERLVPSARVHALSQDGKYSSTIATTDESGYFKLKVEPNSGTYDLFVQPTSANTLIPMVKFPAAFSTWEDTCHMPDADSAESCNLGSLNLGAYLLDPIPLEIWLRAPSSFGGEVSWKGTVVLLQGALGAGEFEQKYTVEDDGSVMLDLFPTATSDAPRLDHTIEIIPPADSPFERMKLSLASLLDVSHSSGIELKLKHALTGELVASDGTPMAGATVQFQRVSDPVSAPSAGASPSAEPDKTTTSVPPVQDRRQFSVITDDQGFFKVWLLGATYQVQAIPAHTSGQPRLHTTLDPAAITSQEHLRLKLPKPSVITGTIRAASANESAGFVGVADVGVEVYRVVDGEAITLGQGRSAADGTFGLTIAE